MTRRGTKRGYIGIDDLEVNEVIKHVDTSVGSFSSSED